MKNSQAKFQKYLSNYKGFFNDYVSSLEEVNKDISALEQEVEKKHEVFKHLRNAEVKIN